MNSRELTLVSTATIFGALASALAYRLLFSNPKKYFSRIDASRNGDVAKKCTPQSPFDPSKRKGYLTWDDYFMAIAFLSAERSKDPNRQVGACLVSQDGIILDLFLDVEGKRKAKCSLYYMSNSSSSSQCLGLGFTDGLYCT
ncbi:hypothetical protein Pint_01180 [Pistacia integerrima]|uniref:Uncharacterized protein n=1 Tax=Pistacia integerrima TaxID=434235 RepID=A0ACC0ZMP3_9ROSI|nr:hypothetical protein Pint_01180 [Pistacia integerrima]